MRQIFPVSTDGQPGRIIGQGEQLGSRERLRPSAADPAVRQLVADLAEFYAYPGTGAALGTGAGTRMSQDRPWVRANMVTSVDGAASMNGRSGGLSGAADRLVFSVLRSLADVVLVGAGTARAEGYSQARASDIWPQLRTGRSATPPIAVVTRRLDLDGRLLAGGSGLARTIVLTTEAAPQERRSAAARTADVVVAGKEGVTAAAAVAALSAAGHRRILTEGGPTLLGELVAENLLDELCLTISPVLEGGDAPRIVRPSDATQARMPGSGTEAGLQAPESAGLRLAGVLEDGEYLLLRYLRA